MFSFFFFLFLLLTLESVFRVRQFFRGKRLLPYSLSSETTLTLMETWPNWETSYNVYDPELGWALRPSTEKKKEGFSYRTNAQGFRSDKDYTTPLSEDILRIAIFGDSFVHGDEVSIEHTIGSQLETLFPERAEVFNYGISGYGTDQAILLAERESKHTQPQVLLLGFLTEHLARNVNRLRRFYVPDLENPFLSKPRFILKNNQLTLLSPNTYPPKQVATLIRNQDLQTLSEGDYFYDSRFYESRWYYFSSFLREYETKRLKQQYKQKYQLDRLYQQPEVFDITFALLKRFVDQARKENRVPFIFTIHFLQDFEKWNEQGHYWKILTDRCVKAQLPILDIGEKLAQDPNFMKNPKQHYLPDGHYTEAMNTRMATLILEAIKSLPDFESLKKRLSLKPK